MLWTFPVQSLCDFAYVVLDNDTSDLLEYHHLIKHPEYKETYTNSFEKESRQLALTRETLFFINKTEIPQDCKDDVTIAFVEALQSGYLKRFCLKTIVHHFLDFA